MPEYKKGVENLPLRQINTSMPIMVYVIDLKNEDEIVQQVQLDYANFDDRKHLGRLTFWAVTHEHSIETMSLKDAMGENENG